MKQEWRKTEKALYLPGPKPATVVVPPMKYFVLSGQGNPNGKTFGEQVGVLFNLAYAVRMMPKSGWTPEGFQEYTVYPLEGIWDLTEEGRKQGHLDKDELVYTIMIRQPEFVNEEVVERALQKARQKNASLWLSEVVFQTIEDGKCLQMTHVGPFDTEPESFAQMDAYLKEQHLQRRDQIHKEIYISDLRKTEPEALRTVLRYFIR